MIRKPNQVRGGEHDVPIQDDSFKKFHQMLAILTEMEEKHQVCVFEQQVQAIEPGQTQGRASPAASLTPRDQI